MKNYIIAHDLGTTGNKATLYDSEGQLRGSAFHGYATEYAQTGWAEQNPEDWWEAVCLSTRKLLQDNRVIADDIACITFSGQMMGCVLLDKAAKPLRNAIIWADQRSVEQERWVGERIAPDKVYKITGHRLSASYSLCKMLWLRDHQTERYQAAHKFVHAKDAMVARLTGDFVTEPSDASGMNLFDLENGTWSKEIIEAAGGNPGQLPDLWQSTDVVGEGVGTVGGGGGGAAGGPLAC